MPAAVGKWMRTPVHVLGANMAQTRGTGPVGQEEHILRTCNEEQDTQRGASKTTRPHDAEHGYSHLLQTLKVLRHHPCVAHSQHDCLVQRIPCICALVRERTSGSYRRAQGPGKATIQGLLGRPGTQLFWRLQRLCRFTSGVP
jgi:hypothetical protein